MFNIIEHTCGDSKLRCIDCGNAICPECMVQCPVGNRCRRCVQRFTSHVLQIDIWNIGRGFIAAFVTGLLFALMQALLPLGGFFMLFLSYFLGTMMGNLIFKISGKKIGTKIAVVVVIGLCLGNFCIAYLSFSLIIFGLGAISPFLGWSNPFAGLFRR